MANKELHSVITIDNEDYSITATKVENALNIKVGNSDPIVYDGSAEKTVTVPAPPTALKNPSSLTIQGNGTTAATYDGSAAKTINIKGSGSTTVTADANGVITINSSGGTGSSGYLGTVSALTSLSTTAKAGDFYRVSTQFDFGSEKAHIGDILIAAKTNPAQTTTDWDLLHADIGVTGVQVEGNGNAITSAGYSVATGVLTLTKGTTFATISHGTADPSTSTTSQYYFKY